MFSVEFLKIYFQQIQNKVIWKLFCVYIMLCTIARKTDKKIKKGEIQQLQLDMSLILLDKKIFKNPRLLFKFQIRI